MCSIHVVSSFVRHSCYYSDSACICVAQSDYFYDYLLRLSDEILHVWYKNWHLLNILAFKCTFGLRFLWANSSRYSRSFHSSPIGRPLFDDSSSSVVYAIHRFYLTRVERFIIRLISFGVGIESATIRFILHPCHALTGSLQSFSWPKP